MLKSIYDPMLLHYGKNGLAKTQSRFPVVAKLYNQDMRMAPIPADVKFVGVRNGLFTWETDADIYSITPPYHVGDILYAKEFVKRICATKTIWFNGDPVSTEEHFGWKYKSTGDILFDDGCELKEDEFCTIDITEEKKWRMPVSMPAEAARTYLRVIRVQVERLQSLDPSDIDQEGIRDRHEFAYTRFSNLWNRRFHSRNYDVSWSTNPWVWKITYEKAID